VVAEGRPSEVLTEDRVREVWGVPVWRGENGATGATVVLPSVGPRQPGAKDHP
jgi:iron complex transport system ATP-binding protein